MDKTVKIQLFGDFRVFHPGETIELPKSRKTRALLAYLIVTDRPQRRDRLCELFWETSNDPKAALRWSLSKIRRVQELAGTEIIEVDRERARASIKGLNTDLRALRALVNSEETRAEIIEPFIKAFQDDFLTGIDLPNLDEYSAWLRGERDQIIEMRTALISTYINKSEAPVGRKLKYAKEWLDIRPFDKRAASSLLKLLQESGRPGELKTWTTLLSDRFEEAGMSFDSAENVAAKAVDPLTEDRRLLLTQKIQFCKTENGTSLAYASVGSGPPLIKAANWLSHLELDWSAPIWSPIYRELARDFQFIRYDERGNGLSDWNVDELSQAVFVRDLETIISQFDYDKVPLLGISQGVAVCIDYAVANPDRVSKLVLFGGYPKGWRVDATPEVTAVREAMMTLTRDGWGQENPAYRHVFSSTFMPTATPQQLSWFDDFQRHTTSPKNAVQFLEAFADIDVREKLSQINVPTLVIHSRGDQRIDVSVGRDMAAEIPGAEFVTLESENHLLLEGEPAAETFIAAVREFLLG